MESSVNIIQGSCGGNMLGDGCVLFAVLFTDIQHRHCRHASRRTVLYYTEILLTVLYRGTVQPNRTVTVGL